MPRRATAKIVKVRDLQGALLHYRIEGVGGPGNSRFSFADKDQVPDFEGEAAWFEMERVFAKPWNYWQPVTRVEPPSYADRC